MTRVPELTGAMVDGTELSRYWSQVLANAARAEVQ
jgi:hypothetical protein